MNTVLKEKLAHTLATAFEEKLIEMGESAKGISWFNVSVKYQATSDIFTVTGDD